MRDARLYGLEELLERIYTLLTEFGYAVWMSQKGTVPVFSNRSTLENCLFAVERAALFLGLITLQYGSGKEKGEVSIRHQELHRAIELDRPRRLLAHDDVVPARC